jgi:AcrR family transcriptional regulator
MPGSAEDTKQRLVDAAAREFAAHGIAGARTGRIARDAKVNEALLFRYFGNKQSLFAHVYDALVVKTVYDVAMDPTDLPRYAGALFDYYRTHQSLLRLSVWAVLEGSDSPATPAVLAANAARQAAIAGAQAAGLIPDELPAGELLALILQLSLSGSVVSPAIGTGVDPSTRRASIVAAVRSLVAKH